MKGLRTDEANKKLYLYGKNILVEKKKKSMLQVFLEQFKDLLVAILIVAALISGFSGNAESAIVIIAVLILNAVLGTVQHIKAEKNLASLKAMSAPIAKVYREGKLKIIPAEEIVPNDLIFLEAGDMVPADGFITENYSLKVNQSVLTGESLPVEKQFCENVYSGSLVTYGKAEVQITKTGMETEMGKIADMLNKTKQRKTPLQKSLDNFSKILSVCIVFLCVIVYLLSVYKSGMQPMDAMLFAIALAVAAIPEALSSIVTIVLALGTQKMAKENAIIKDLKAVESLGCVSVICSDKTGTLTQNKMEVKKLYAAGDIYNGVITPKELREGYAPHDLLLQEMIICSDAVTNNNEVGDPTEVALIKLTDSQGIDENEIRKKHPRTAEIAFDSERKMMSVLIQNPEEPQNRIMITKGAPDVIYKRCQKSPREYKKIVKELSSEGLRVLAFAHKIINKDTVTFEDEKDLIFDGFVAMHDPARPESKNAVLEAKKAGIKTVMITGDSKITATAIAKEVGIFHNRDIAVEGAELDNISDEELEKALPYISVYARVKPEHKIRIVGAWQRCGKIVAMTGDGVNDAPALKKADIGIAMGITGTEVSKDAAGMILADDNFATIIKAVENGRAVYENIKNAIAFLLSGNMAGIISVVCAAVFGLSAPFAAVQLLFMNLLTDSLPAIAIGMDKPKENLMRRKPRDPKKNILDGKLLLKILLHGTMIAAATMAAYFMGTNSKEAMTMAFVTLTLARLFYSFGHIAVLKEKPSKYLISAFIFGVILLAAVMFVPSVGKFFMVAKLSEEQIKAVVLFASVPNIIIQAYNFLKK